MQAVASSKLERKLSFGYAHFQPDKVLAHARVQEQIALISLLLPFLSLQVQSIASVSHGFRTCRTRLSLLVYYRRRFIRAPGDRSVRGSTVVNISYSTWHESGCFATHYQARGIADLRTSFHRLAVNGSACDRHWLNARLYTCKE